MRPLLEVVKSRSPQFYPPKLNPPLIWTAQRFAPLVARVVYQLDLIVSADPSVSLDTLQTKRCLLLCNHPTFDDPIAMFLLSGYWNEPFYYMTAYEQFRSWKGGLYQQMGAYSVQRGLADRNSIVQTLELLIQPKCKLVIFPEGGCSFQNDTVMPFRPGAVQLGLQALSRAAKRGQAIPDLYAVPISLKYAYVGKMKAVIDKTLRNLEQKLGITPTGDIYQRLRVAAARVLAQCEQEHGVVPDAELNWNQRIENLKATVIQQCEEKLGLPPAPEDADRERVYRLRHALEQQRTIVLEDGTDDWATISKGLMRVLNFDAIYDGYVSEKPTPERFLDTLTRLEREVFGIDKPSPKRHRHAFMRIGKPINLKDYVDAYNKARSTTVTLVVQQLQQTVQDNLDILADATARGISW
jgi:1-acyl-sn-glycerol-3-phosphate acyltransferase